MKNIIVSALFLFVSVAITAQCKTKTEVDQFTGAIKTNTEFEAVSQASSSRLELKLSQIISGQDTSMALFINTRSMGMTCFNADSKLLIKSGDDILSINLSGRIECASSSRPLLNYGEITREDVAFLKSHYVDAIRVYFAEGYTDYQMSKRPDYFMRTLICFK